MDTKQSVGSVAPCVVVSGSAKKKAKRNKRKAAVADAAAAAAAAAKAAPASETHATAATSQDPTSSSDGNDNVHDFRVTEDGRKTMKTIHDWLSNHSNLLDTFCKSIEVFEAARGKRTHVAADANMCLTFMNAQTKRIVLRAPDSVMIGRVTNLPADARPGVGVDDMYPADRTWVRFQWGHDVHAPDGTDAKDDPNTSKTAAQWIHDLPAIVQPLCQHQTFIAPRACLDAILCCLYGTKAFRTITGVCLGADPNATFLFGIRRWTTTTMPAVSLTREQQMDLVQNAIRNIEKQQQQKNPAVGATAAR